MTVINLQYLDNRRESKLKHPFRLFLKIFRIFGMDLEGKKECTFKYMMLKIWCVLAAFIFHHRLLCEIIWYTRHSFQENALAESIIVWSSALTFDMLLSKRQSIQRLLDIVKEEGLKMDVKCIQQQAKFILISCCIIWCYVLVYVSQYLIFMNERDYENTHVNPLIFIEKYIPDHYKKSIYFLLICLESFFIQGILTFTIAFYLLLSLTASKWFQQLKSNYTIPNENERNRLNLYDIQRFSQIFDNLSSNVQLLDNVFSRPVGIWLLMILSLLCVRIVTLVNPVMKTTKQMAMVIFLTFSRAGTTLIGMCFIADYLHQNAISTLFHLDTLCEKSIILNLVVYQEIQMAFSRFSFNPTHLTMLKVTRLDRRFLMSCVGMMATYIIISIQLFPETDK